MSIQRTIVAKLSTGWRVIADGFEAAMQGLERAYAWAVAALGNLLVSVIVLALYAALVLGIAALLDIPWWGALLLLAVLALLTKK